MRGHRPPHILRYISMGSIAARDADMPCDRSRLGRAAGGAVYGMPREGKKRQGGAGRGGGGDRRAGGHIRWQPVAGFGVSSLPWAPHCQ